MSYSALVKFIVTAVQFHFSDLPEWVDRQKFMIDMGRQVLDSLIDEDLAEELKVGEVPQAPFMLVVPLSSDWIDMGKPSMCKEMSKFHKQYCAQQDKLRLTQEVFDQLQKLVDDEKEQEKVLEEIKNTNFDREREADEEENVEGEIVRESNQE